MSNFKKKYADATAAIDEASKARIEASKGILVEFLAKKGLVEGQPCRIAYVSTDYEKHIVGVFKSVTKGSSVKLKFYPYKRTGELSKNPKAFYFGNLPDMLWEDYDSIKSVVPCEAPTIKIKLEA